MASSSPRWTPPSPDNMDTSTRGRVPAPIRATYAYSSLGMVRREQSPHFSPDRITRHASPSRAMVRQASEDIVPRVPQPYRTSFSAVTSPRRVSRDGSVPTSPVSPTSFMSRGSTARATMPGRIVPVAGVKHKSNDELMTPEEKRQHTHHEKLKSNPQKRDIRFLSTPTKLHKLEMVQGMPPKSYGVDSSNELLDTTLDSVFTDGATTPMTKSSDSIDKADGLVQDFMQGSHKGQPVSPVVSKPIDSGYVEGTVIKKTLIQKEYVHVQNISFSKEDLKLKDLPKPNLQTQAIVKDLKKGKRVFSFSSFSKEKPKGSTTNNSDSAPASPQYVHKDSQGRSTTMPSEVLLETQKPTVSVKRSLSTSITKLFKRMSPKSVRKMSPRTIRRNQEASSKSTPEGSSSSIIDVEICDIHIDSPSNSDMSNSPLHKLPKSQDYGNGTLSPEKINNSNSRKPPLPDNSARLLKSINENKVVMDKRLDTHSPINKPKEAISMKPLALKAVEFSENLDSATNRNRLKQNRQLSADNSDHCDAASPSFNTYPESVRSAPDSPKSRTSRQGSFECEEASKHVGVPTRTYDVKRLQPPNTLNVRQVTIINKGTFQFPSMSSESIGQCSLDVYNTGSDPSLSSRNGLSGQRSSSTASKRTLVSQTSVNSPPTTTVVKTDLNVQLNDSSKNGVLDSNVDASNTSPKTPSYLKLSCALGGYNQYSAYTSPKQQKKLHVITATATADQNRTESPPADASKTEYSVVPNGVVHMDNGAELEHVQRTGKRTEQNLEDLNGEKHKVNGDAVVVANGDCCHLQLNGASDSEHGVAVGNEEELTDTRLDLSRVNGVDEVDFTLKAALRKGKLDLSEEKLDTPTPSKDGAYFLAQVAIQEARLGELCRRAEDDLDSCSLTDETSGRIRAAIGKAQLLTTKKFKQFKGLCNQNMQQSSDEPFHTTAQDLAGFWDMVLIQVDDVDGLFAELDHLRLNGWKTPEKQTPILESKAVPSPRSSAKPRSTNSAVKATPKSAKAKEAARIREEQRKRLLEAKRAGRQRKQSHNDGEQEVEIFVT